MTWFNSLVRRCLGNGLTPRRRLNASHCETLESRRHLTVSVTNVELIGTVTSVSEIVLSFNGALDPTTAENVNSYAFGKRDPQKAPDAGFDVGSLFSPFIAGRARLPKPVAVKHGKIQFASAVYDDSAHTVTLTPYAPFRAVPFFQFLRVRSTGLHTLLDANGLPFNGAVDATANWKVLAGKVIRYTDAAHDHIVLKLHGPGKLFVFMRRGNNADPLIFISAAKPKTTVTGAVRFNPDATTPVNIAELAGATGITTNLLTDSDFSVQTIAP